MISWVRRWFRKLFHWHRWDYDSRTLRLRRIRHRVPGHKLNPAPFTVEAQFRTCTICGRVERASLRCALQGSRHPKRWHFLGHVDPTKLIEEQCYQEALEDFDRRLQENQ